MFKGASWIIKRFLVHYQIPHLSNIAIAILDFSVFLWSYLSSNYCDSNSCRSFTLLKALAKSNGNLFAITFKSEKERQLLLSQ